MRVNSLPGVCENDRIRIRWASSSKLNQIPGEAAMAQQSKQEEQEMEAEEGRKALTTAGGASADPGAGAVAVGSCSGWLSIITTPASGLLLADADLLLRSLVALFGGDVERWQMAIRKKGRRGEGRGWGCWGYSPLPRRSTLLLPTVAARLPPPPPLPSLLPPLPSVPRSPSALPMHAQHRTESEGGEAAVLRPFQPHLVSISLTSLP